MAPPFFRVLQCAKLQIPRTWNIRHFKQAKDRRSHPEHVVNIMTCAPFFDAQKFPVQFYVVIKVVGRISFQKTGKNTSMRFIWESVSGIPESLSVVDCRIALV